MTVGLAEGIIDDTCLVMIKYYNHELINYERSSQFTLASILHVLNPSSGN